MDKQSLIYIFSNKRIEKMYYNLYLPQGYDPKKAYPLLVCLHGAGERGYDHGLIDVWGVPKEIKEGLEVDAVVLAPQCPENLIWNLLTFELKELIDHIAAEYKVDEDRIALSGFSMGGYGTWEMGMSYPGFFCALGPICGGGISWRADLIGKTPVWAFHGDRDNVVPIGNSYEMVDRLNGYGGCAKLTVLHGVDHNSWEPAYRESTLISWLLSHTR